MAVDSLFLAMVPVALVGLLLWLAIGVSRDIRRGINYFSYFHPDKDERPDNTRSIIKSLAGKQRMAYVSIGIIIVLIPILAYYFIPNFGTLVSNSAVIARGVGGLFVVGFLFVAYATVSR